MLELRETLSYNKSQPRPLRGFPIEEKSSIRAGPRRRAHAGHRHQPMNAKDIIQGVTKRVVPKPVLNAAVRPMVRSVLSLAFGRKGYRINIGGRGMFRLSPDFVFGGWENFGDRHNGGFVPCIEACTEKSVFIDVGAHIGLHSLPVNSVLAPGGQVFAFEPSGGSYSYLRKHIAYNAIDNIHPYQLIVGDCSADAVVFYEHLDPSSPWAG